MGKLSTWALKKCVKETELLEKGETQEESKAELEEEDALVAD